MSGLDNIPTQYEYENAFKVDADFNGKIVKIGELNELAEKI